MILNRLIPKGNRRWMGEESGRPGGEVGMEGGGGGCTPENPESSQPKEGYGLI